VFYNRDRVFTARYELNLSIIFQINLGPLRDMSIAYCTRIIGKFLRDLLATVSLYLDRIVNLNAVMFDTAAHIHIRSVIVLLAYRPFKF
jgi:hypothetical protein